MSPSPLSAFENDHHFFMDRVLTLRRAAESLANGRGDVRTVTDETLTFLHHDLRPHAEAEHETFYPVVERAFGSTGAADLLLADHDEIDRMTAALGDVGQHLATRTEAVELRVEVTGMLFELYAVIRQHFGKEEYLVFPLLDGLLGTDGRRALMERHGNLTEMHRLAELIARENPR